jgi:PUA domain protein
MTKRRSLRHREVGNLLKELAQQNLPGEILPSKRHIEALAVENDELILADGAPILAHRNDRYFPFIGESDLLVGLPRIIVDMGAVPHICNGADVMVKGVTGIEGNFEKDALVIVVDERHRKPLAVGIALADSSSIAVAKSGKVIRNEHYVGDKLWKTMRGVT